MTPRGILLLPEKGKNKKYNQHVNECINDKNLDRSIALLTLSAENNDTDAADVLADYYQNRNKLAKVARFVNILEKNNDARACIYAHNLLPVGDEKRGTVLFKGAISDDKRCIEMIGSKVDKYGPISLLHLMNTYDEYMIYISLHLLSINQMYSAKKLLKSIKSDMPMKHYLLSYIYNHLGSDDKALKHLLKITNDIAESNSYIATIYKERYRFSESRRYKEKARSMGATKSRYVDNILGTIQRL